MLVNIDAALVGSMAFLLLVVYMYAKFLHHPYTLHKVTSGQFYNLANSAQEGSSAFPATQSALRRRVPSVVGAHRLWVQKVEYGMDRKEGGDRKEIVRVWNPAERATTKEGPAKIGLEVAKKANIPLFVNPLHGGVDGRKEPFVQDVVQRNPVYLEGMKRSLRVDMSAMEMGKEIGNGAFGSVRLATWRGTKVAVKLLACQHLTPATIEEFEAEVQLMHRLRHPNIVLLLGASFEAPLRGIVVEYLSHGSLWDVLRFPIQVNVYMQKCFARDIAQGMNYLHTFSPPILHRDLKSPNILADDAYHLKISDFGMSRVRAQCQTMDGHCGTIQWMAPEILAAKPFTEKADVYAFGIVLWETVARACPYDGLSQIEASLGVLNTNLRPTVPETCPLLLETLMKSCWSPNPIDRPTFASILLQLDER